MTTLTEEISARLSTVGSAKDLRLCMNLTRDHVNKYNLEANVYPTVSKYNGQDHMFIARFHTKFQPQHGHKWRVKLEKENGVLRGATVQLDPKVLGLRKEEKILGVPLEIQPTDDGLVFKLVPDEFIPRSRELKKITTQEEKKEAGFVKDSAFGIKLDAKVESAIMKKKAKSMAARLAAELAACDDEV